MAITCDDPACAGAIEDGYCNVCGAPGNGTTSAGAASTSGRLATRSTRTGSSGLRSAAIGSRRTGATGFTVRSQQQIDDSARTRASRMGVGLTTVPPLAPVDPLSLVMAEPVVPEARRVCAGCGAAVGRSRAGSAGRTAGFCPSCGSAFDFTARLQRGDAVSAQYEVIGALAHGGLGWVYLAKDTNVSDRPVVLKGLLNTGDREAYEAAVAEQRFLAEVHHPLIVEIHNFVEHEGEGYIVMEYVGGSSLKQLLVARMAQGGGRFDPLPLAIALAYLIEILPAFSYLHAHNLVYCDFKPDNVIQVEDGLKLIDLGGVRRVDDVDSAIYGTIGYQAPEVGELGPSPASDLYTIGRTLAVLTFEFRGYQREHVTTLPSPGDVDLFREHDSYYRLLRKATAANPADRFQSAEEMREQMIGVLREVVALTDSGATRSTTSSPLFEPPALDGHELTVEAVPGLRAEPTDPMLAWLAGVATADPAELVRALDRAPRPTLEVHLAGCRAHIDLGDLNAAQSRIDAIAAENPWEWRAVWMQGLLAVARGDFADAVAQFNTAYGELPGELAPKLALAMACERAGQAEPAEELYQLCGRVDLNYLAPAAFGLARIGAGRGDVDGALAALDLIPPTSRSYVDSRRQRARLLVGAARRFEDLALAVDALADVTLDPGERHRVTADALIRALELAAVGEAPQVLVAGRPATRPALRDGLAAAYRQLAALADSRRDRVRLIEASNRARPWSLV